MEALITLMLVLSLLMQGFAFHRQSNRLQHPRFLHQAKQLEHDSTKSPQIFGQNFKRNAIVNSKSATFTALFSSRSPSTGGGSGGTALDTRVDQKVSTKIRDEIEKNWRLILHDDTIHTIQQVCDILSSSCPLCPGPRAYEVTMEVHMTGAGTVCIANKKIVSEYTKVLQAAGLTVSMAADDDFESGGDD